MLKFIRYPLKVLEGLFDRALAVAGAVTLVQFPQFYAQYLQRLGGHLDEARRIVSQYAKAAAVHHLTLREYIDIHLNSGNKIFISTGKLIQGFIIRLEHLEASFRTLKEATPWERLIVFLRTMDPEIARQTWANFTPGIPTTMEALIYALTGMVLIWGIYQGVKGIIRLIFRKIFSPKSLPGHPGIPA